MTQSGRGRKKPCGAARCRNLADWPAGCVRSADAARWRRCRRAGTSREV